MGVLKGLAGIEDLELGLGMAERMEGFGTKGVRKQICAEDFPILDSLGQYTADEVEAALAEARADAITMLYSAADALLAGGYITDREDFIAQILNAAANAAAEVNSETDEGYEGGDTPAVTSTPAVAGLLTIMYPGMIRPSTEAMLWVEAIGGVAPYTWAFDDNNSGGSLTAQTDTTRVLYAAGAVESADIIRVTDANGLTATCQIAVSSTAPDVVIYGPTTAVVSGPDINLEATGGATPYTWAIHINLSGSSFVAGSGTNMSYTPGATVGRDTIRVTETGGAIDLHDIDVQASSVIATSPLIHGATSAVVETKVVLQCVGGASPVAWTISDDQSGAAIVLGAASTDPAVVALAEQFESVYGAGGASRVAEYTAGITSGVSDTITATDADGNTDTHGIAVTSAPTVTQPEIYGYENCPINAEIILKVYGGLGPYDWEIVTNNSGGELFEYEGDTDGYNRFRGGSVSAVSDTIRVTDANGNTDEHVIYVYDPADESPTPDPTDPYPWPPWWNDGAGYLVGNVSPQGAIDGGAKWKANAGDWNDSGEEVNGFLVGEKVTVAWRPITDWAIPADEEITIVAGANTASGAYEQSSDVISYFDVSVNLSDYFPGEVMRVSIIPRDAGGDRVYPATTNILIETVSEGIDLLAGTCQRTDAATSVAASIAGGGTYYVDLVWFGTGTLPDPLTITVKLTSDPTITGSTTVGLDATAEVVVSDTGAGAYVNETKYEHITVQMRNGDGAALSQWDGNITLTPSGTGTPLISVDGSSYASSVTLAVTNGSFSTDIYLKDASGDVLITAACVDHPTLTDTVTLTEVPVTFVFTNIWDPVNLTALIKDNTNFDAEITAMQGGSPLTTYDEPCVITSSVATLSGETDVGSGGEPAWSSGVVSVTIKIDWDGTPSELTLTCADDATGLSTGNRVCKTDEFTPDTSEVCALAQSMKWQGGSDVLAAIAFAEAKAFFQGSPLYDPDNYLAGSAGAAWCDGRTVGKDEGWQHYTAGYNCKVGYGIAVYYVAATNFDDSDDLFAEIVFQNPAKVTLVWSAADLIIGIQPVTNYQDQSLATMWANVVARGTLITIPTASITFNGTILVDLGIKKSDLPAGVSIQVLLRMDVAIDPASYVSSTDKNTNIRIASVTIKG